MSKRPTLETDTLSNDPVIERRDVPARVWRKMAEIERRRDEAREQLAAALARAWKTLDELSLNDLETVLVWTNLGSRFAIYHAGGTFTIYGMGKESAYARDFHVTHWMSLPRPPEERAMMAKPAAPQASGSPPIQGESNSVNDSPPAPAAVPAPEPAGGMPKLPKPLPCKTALGQTVYTEIDYDALRAHAEQLQARVRELENQLENQRNKVAGCSTAAIGYWKEGDSLHPDYECAAIHDVARLYQRYEQTEARVRELDDIRKELCHGISLQAEQAEVKLREAQGENIGLRETLKRRGKSIMPEVIELHHKLREAEKVAANWNMRLVIYMDVLTLLPSALFDWMHEEAKKRIDAALAAQQEEKE